VCALIVNVTFEPASVAVIVTPVTKLFEIADTLVTVCAAFNAVAAALFATIAAALAAVVALNAAAIFPTVFCQNRINSGDGLPCASAIGIFWLSVGSRRNVVAVPEPVSVAPDRLNESDETPPTNPAPRKAPDVPNVSALVPDMLPAAAHDAANVIGDVPASSPEPPTAADCENDSADVPETAVAPETVHNAVNDSGDVPATDPEPDTVAV
jgi:hypothetical protein